MATFPEHPGNEPGRVERVQRTDDVRTIALAGSSTVLALCGAAAIVLSIIGLVNAWPVWMVNLSVLVIGGGLIAHGLGIMGRNALIVRPTGTTWDPGQVASAVSPEFLAGCVGVTLGILAIIGIYPALLSAVAVIAFGSTLVFGSSSAYAEEFRADPGSVESRGFLSRPMRAHLMMGLGVLALGIIAVCGIRPLLLTLVGSLSLGFTLLVTGSALAVRMAYRMSQERREVRA
jgi:hypothetical protein